MNVEIGIRDDEGRVFVREGAVTNWQEMTNPETKLAYGWRVEIIFNDFQPPAIEQKKEAATNEV